MTRPLTDQEQQLTIERIRAATDIVRELRGSQGPEGSVTRQLYEGAVKFLGKQFDEGANQTMTMTRNVADLDNAADAKLEREPDEYNRLEPYTKPPAPANLPRVVCHERPYNVGRQLELETMKELGLPKPIGPYQQPSVTSSLIQIVDKGAKVLADLSKLGDPYPKREEALVHYCTTVSGLTVLCGEYLRQPYPVYHTSSPPEITCPQCRETLMATGMAESARVEQKLLDEERDAVPAPAKKTQCEATYNDAYRHYRCDKPAGHAGDHESNQGGPIRGDEVKRWGNP